MADKHLLQYEMMVILKPDLTQKATKEALQSVRDLIAEAKGSINHEDIWEKRDLAYGIKKYTEGYYAVFYFNLDSAELAGLEADLDLEQQILRRLIIKFPQNLTLDGYLEETKRVQIEEEAIQAEKEKEKEAKEAKAQEIQEARAARMKKKEEAPKADAESEIDAMA